METLLAITTCMSVIAAVFAVLAFFRARSKQDPSVATQSGVEAALRAEADRVRQSVDDSARNLREELGSSLRGFLDTTLNAFTQLGADLRTQNADFGTRVETRTKNIGDKLDQDLARMGTEATQNRDALRATVEQKLDASTDRQANALKDFREELTQRFNDFGVTISNTITQLGNQQKERLDSVNVSLKDTLTSSHDAQEALRVTVEGRLDAIRQENSQKLEEMRRTVDEKLQTTLESRLGESFSRVVEQLERVHTGIGEMRTMAAGVGDLTKLLSNVRVRGTFGEVQLSRLLEQCLSPEQYKANAQVREHTQERVEFAIRLPGKGDQNELLIPIDAKFPQEDYDRLLDVSEAGDVAAIADAVAALEARIKQCAKTIRDKYINPPITTEFAILFLPIESLFAEVLRKPGLFELVQREYHVTITGPTTLGALLNALQMGFRTLALERRSGEVWQILGAVQSEFQRYNKVVDTIGKQLRTATNSVDTLGSRTRAMSRKLKDVERIPEETVALLLGPSFSSAEVDEDTEETT